MSIPCAGAFRALLPAVVVLCVSSVAAQQSELQTLLPGDGAAGQRFGSHIAIFGNTAIVGARGDAELGTNAGAAYVFVRSGGVWTEQQKLTAADGAAGKQFGVKVALFDDTALIGSASDNPRGANSGSAYVFVRSGNVWTQQQKLIASDESGGDKFGVTVALFEETAVVGAFHDDDNGPDSGSAYVFVRNGTAWSEQAKLTASDGFDDDQFGGAVAIHEDTVLVGASTDDNLNPDDGSAYVFVRSGTVWTEQQKLLALDGSFIDLFGCGVDLFGDTALIGALGNDDKGKDSGSAYVFERVGGVWTQRQKLLASNGAVGDRFGFVVALFGTRAVIGAARHQSNGQGSGSAYAYVREAGVWRERIELNGSTVGGGDWFGIATSVYGDTAVVGTFGDDDLGSNSGSAFVFDVSTVPPGPHDVAMSDADGDGNLDVATANGGDHDASIWRNNGLGSLTETSLALDVADRGAVAVAFGDLDDDGLADDLAVACVQSATVARVIDVAGTPSAQSSASGGLRPVGVVCGDLDSDGRDEVIVAREGLPFGEGAGIAVSYNGGPFTDVVIPAGNAIRVVALALDDLDGDGDNDLAALAHGDTDSVLLFEGDGQGGLTFGGALALPTSTLATGLCSDDFDGDGSADLALMLPELVPLGAKLRVYLFTGAGPLESSDFTAGADVDSGFGFARGVACGELDGDTLPGFVMRRDFVVAHSGGVKALIGLDASASTLLGNEFLFNGSNLVAAAVGDLNGDCVEDVVIARPAFDDVLVRLSTVRAAAQDFGTGCPGTGGLVPALTSIGGRPTLGNPDFGVRLTNALPSAMIAIMYSPSMSQTPLPGGCEFYMGDPYFSVVKFANGAGSFDLVFGVSSATKSLCADLFLQVAVLDPNGAYQSSLALSNAVRVLPGR